MSPGSLSARLRPILDHMAGIVRVALVVPLSGTLGLIGPGAVNCAALAAREIDEAGGILGLSLIHI